MIRCVLAALTALALTAGPLWPETRVIAPADQPRWDAVGRVNNGGFRTTGACTGVLVAADLVLTAGHCVAGYKDAPPERLRDIHFVAGWNRGSHAGHGRAVALHFPPRHQPPPLSTESIPADMVLIRIAPPITDIAPLTIGRPDSGLVGFMAYANTRLHAPALTSNCAQMTRATNLMLLTCSVVSGNSGAPVLAGLPDAPVVVGVISAQRGTGAFAAALNDWVFEIVNAP